MSQQKEAGLFGSEAREMSQIIHPQCETAERPDAGSQVKES